MKIDCSKISNKGDLLAIACVILIFCLLAAAVLIAGLIDNFAAGFFSATVIWNWHKLIYKPLDKILDKLWKSDNT